MQTAAKMGFAAVFGLLGISLLGRAALIPILLCLFAGLVFFLWRKNGWRTVLAVGVALAAAYAGYQLYTGICYLPAVALNGKSAAVTAEVLDCSNTGGGYLYELRILPEEGAVLPETKVKVYSRELLGVDYYDRISAVLSFEEGGLDLGGVLGDYGKSDGCFLFGTLESPACFVGSPSVKPLFYYTNHLRDRIAASLEQIFSREDSALLKGILLGNTSQISMETRQQFRQAGISHVFSVSGLHLTLITQSFFAVCGVLGIRRRVSALGGCALVVIFAMVTGCSFSVIRSAIMLILYALGNVARRRSNGLNSLGIAGLLMSAMNPYLVYDVGFLLSFSATLGILLLASPVTKWISGKLHAEGKVVRAMVSGFSVSLGATVGTLPVMLLNFKEVSLVGLLVNPLLNIYLLLALVGALLVSILGMIPFLFPIAGFCGKIIHVVLAVITFAADRFTKLPFSSLPVGFPWVSAWVLAAVLLLVLGMVFRKRKTIVKLAAVAGCTLLLLGIGASYAVRYGCVQISVLRSGSQSASIVTSGAATVVYGCEGDEYFYDTLRSYLRGRGIASVDLFIQPSESAKELERTADFSRSFRINSLLVPSSAESSVFLGAGGDSGQVETFLPGIDVTLGFGTLELREGFCLVQTLEGGIYLGGGVPDSPVDLCVTSSADERELSEIRARKIALLSPAEDMAERGWLYLQQNETLFLLNKNNILQIV